MTNDKCRKLKSIPEERFKDLIKADPIRPDNEVDRDCRVIEYEDLLTSNGFEYKFTRLSRGGGVRTYENRHTDKMVEVMRDWDNNEVQFWVGTASKGKELGHGKGLQNLKKKI